MAGLVQYLKDKKFPEKMNNLQSRIITVAYIIEFSVRASQSLGLKRLESKQKNEAFENTQAKKKISEAT